MYSEHKSASRPIYGGLGGVIGGFEPPPLKLKTCIHTRRLNFMEYMHALHFASELPFIKKLFEFHIFKV